MTDSELARFEAKVEPEPMRKRSPAYRLKANEARRRRHLTP